MVFRLNKLKMIRELNVFYLAKNAISENDSDEYVLLLQRTNLRISSSIFLTIDEF